MPHSVLDPHGPFARLILEQGRAFAIVSVVVYVLVMAFVIHALVRRHRALDPESGEYRARERRLTVVVSGAVALTVLTLVFMAIVDFRSMRALAQPPADPLRISITGHQWWWEIEYEDPMPSRRFRTANELRIPVGRPVELTLTSRDVIHSFWVPNLQGKRDLIPGLDTDLVLQADRTGVYRGQCAEFCGHQHAWMRITLHALAPEDFERWAANERAAARPPSTEAQARGQAVFMSSSCILCHAIRGTSAGASVAPDLTHLAGRRTLAAGALENTPEHLALWIVAPQAVKPGTQMPTTPISGEDLQALIEYLGSLQ